MSTDKSASGLWLLTVGVDFNLYFKSATDGDITSAKDWASWGSKNKIRGEVSAMHLASDAVEVFCTDATNGHMMCKWSSEKTPSNATDNWYDLGGVMAGSPVALPTAFDKASEQYYIICVGMNGALYGLWWNAKWTWSSLGGGDSRIPAFQPEKIACSTDGNGRIDIVAVAVTNDIYHRYFNGVNWSAWTAVGNNVGGSRPVCWTTSKSRVDIVGKDNTDMKLYQTACDNGVWLGWQKLADTQVSFNPAGSLNADDPNRIDLAVVSMTGELMHNYLITKPGALGSWRAGDYAKMGGLCSSSPKITTRKGLKVDFFVRGMDNAIWYKWWNGSAGWVEWKSLGGANSNKPS